jgi:hypothetical protein
MTPTYRNGEHTIELKRGRIIAASHHYFAAGPNFQIGSKITADQLGRFGYRRVRVATQYDVWGRKIS